MEKLAKLILYLIVVIVSSCETVINVKVPFNGPIITVNGYIHPDSIVYLSLTQSKFILDEDPFIPIEDADIFLYEGEKEVEELLNAGNGWYFGKFKPEVGKHYILKVEASTGETVYAEANVPQRVGIDQVKISDRSVMRNFELHHVMEIKIDDPIDQNNLYELLLLANINEKVFRNDTIIHEVFYHYEVDLAFENPRLEEHNSIRGSSSLLFNDEILNNDRVLKIYAKSSQIEDLHTIDEKYEHEDGTIRLLKSDELQLVLRHVDQSYFNFKKSLKLHVQSKGNPFAEPVKVYSNIKNGLGIFAGYASSRYEIDIDR